MHFCGGDNSIVETATDAQIETELSELQEKLNRYKLDEEAKRIGNGDYSGEMTNTDLANDGIIKEIYVIETGLNVGVIDIELLGEKSNLGNNSKNINVDQVESMLDFDDVFVIEYVTNDIYYIKDGQKWKRDGEAGLSKERADAIDKGPVISVTPSTYEEEEGTVDIQVQIEERENALSSANKYEYYLSTKEDDLEKGEWEEYKEGEKETIGEDLTGEYYLYVKEIEDIKGIKSTGGKEVIIDGKRYHRYGPYMFDNGEIIRYKIVYNLNGGQAEGNPTTYTNKSETFALNEPVKSGAKFLGWTGSNGETPQKIVTIEKGSTGDREYIANWQNIGIPTVELSPNGGIYTMPTEGNAVIETKLTAIDGGTGLNILQYAWSTSNTVEPTQWNNFTNNEIIKKTDITSAGTYYLWTNVLDDNGNRAEEVKVSNPFIIKENEDTNSLITITPNTTNWTNKDIVATVVYGATLTNNRKAGFGTTLDLAKEVANENTAISVTATENGYIYAEATDIAGNKVSKYIKITNIDKILPVISSINKGTNKISDPTFASGLSSAAVYNNSNNGNVTLSRVAASSDNPTTSGYMLEVKTTGTASPGLGGIVQHVASENGRIFRHRIIAKIPVGYKIERAANSCGTGAVFTWFTPQEGTGEWELYEYEVKCGSGGTYSTFGHIYLEKTTATSDTVTWNIAYSNIIDMNAGGALLKQSDPTFRTSLNSAIAYNNLANGNVTVSRVTGSSDLPTTSGYMLEIKTTGTATPGLGGYYQATASAANQVYRHRIIAKIPIGYKINMASNSVGNNSELNWITSQEGTGKWEVYEYQIKCGDSGTFSTFGHVYLEKTTATSNTVTWNVAYSSIVDEGRFLNKNKITFLAKDNASGIYRYGFSSSATTQPSNYYTNLPNRAKPKVSILDLNINQYSYEYLWVSDHAGNTSIIKLRHFISPYISKQPSSVTVSNGGTATFSVSVVTGAPETGNYTLRYRWQYRTSSSGSWQNTSSTSSSMSVTGSSSVNGYQYRCVITNGIYTLYSNTVTLRVNIPSHTCNTNGYCNELHSHSAWTCIGQVHNGKTHYQYRHPLCTVCGKISASWLKCPEYPEGVQMQCPA